MYTLIIHPFLRSTGAIKLLSSQSGRINIQTIRDVRIYAHTQGIIYDSYRTKDQITEYFLKIAELMRGENRNRWAAYCYIEALKRAWDKYTQIMTFETDKSTQDYIDPYDIYRTARLYMLDVGYTISLKRLKAAHDNCREYLYACREEVILKREITAAKRIEELIDESIKL